MNNDQIAALAIIAASFLTLGYCVLRAFVAHKPEADLYTPPADVQAWRERNWGGGAR